MVVKAQVKTGGRGKAGGVKLANTPEEAREKAAAILGMDIKGHTVHRVLVTEASDIAEEYYFSFLLDRGNRTFLAMCSAEGGMEIEQLAVERPDALARIPIDPIAGVDRAKAAEIAAAGKIPAAVADQAADVIVKLWETFVAEDATLVEVNPLVRDPQDKVVALDGKVTLDDNAGFRHPGHAELVDQRTEDPLEAKAKAKHLNYVKLDGAVGIIGNGAGLVMSTLDVVAYAGREARRREARELPRHRRRRVGGDHGRGLGRRARRPGRQERVRERLRRHHRVRRGRERHRRGTEDPR